MCVLVCVCVFGGGWEEGGECVLVGGLSAGLIAVDGERLARPPKWHPPQKKTCMVAGDPYTLPEHFLNLSSVFLRHK